MSSKKFKAIEPDMQLFFHIAKQIVNEEMQASGRRETVIEMLDYGQRLDGGTPAQKGQQQRRARERAEEVEEDE